VTTKSSPQGSGGVLVISVADAHGLRSAVLAGSRVSLPRGRSLVTQHIRLQF
jgi:hypothetical protein